MTLANIITVNIYSECFLFNLLDRIVSWYQQSFQNVAKRTVQLRFFFSKSSLFRCLFLGNRQMTSFHFGLSGKESQIFTGKIPTFVTFHCLCVPGSRKPSRICCPSRYFRGLGGLNSVTRLYIKYTIRSCSLPYLELIISLSPLRLQIDLLAQGGFKRRSVKPFNLVSYLHFWKENRRSKSFWALLRT